MYSRFILLTKWARQSSTVLVLTPQERRYPKKLMYEWQQLRRLRRAAVFFCQLHHVCLPFVVGNKNLEFNL